MMKISAGIIISVLLILTAACGSMSGGGSLSAPSGETTYLSTSASTGVHVRLMRGLGGYNLGPGVDQIAALIAKIRGVTLVKVFEYTQTQLIADQVNAEPLSVVEYIGGYSCGANASPDAAQGVRRKIAVLAVIQASEWCGDYSVPAWVERAQETYNPNCAQTAGLGCRLLSLAPDFPPSHFTVIDRPDCHPCADTDPDAQNDMVDAARALANPRLTLKSNDAGLLPRDGHIRRIVRHHGERVF